MKPTFALLIAALLLGAGCGRKTDAATSPASLDELNRALQVVVMKTGKFPPPQEEVARLLQLQGKALPKPPAGKRLVLDPQTRQYRWE